MLDPIFLDPDRVFDPVADSGYTRDVPDPDVHVRTSRARREERDARTEFGDAYTRYEANTPAFFPRFGAGNAITEPR